MGTSEGVLCGRKFYEILSGEPGGTAELGFKVVLETPMPEVPELEEVTPAAAALAAFAFSGRAGGLMLSTTR